MPAPNDAKTPNWQYSEAKKIMTQDMMDGIVPVHEEIKDPEGMYNQLYGGREEFLDFPYNKNVRSRISRLQATVAKLGDAAKYDEAAFKRDRTLNPTSTVGYNGRVLWKDTEADRLLKEDIEAKVHERLSPSEILLTRPCYAPFGAKRIGQRIYQLTEKSKKFGATPGQMRSKNKKLPAGCKEKSRKGVLDPYNNA